MTEVLTPKDPFELAKGCQELNELESKLAQMEPVQMPVIHRFTPGMYAREIFMPANTLLTSAIHRQEHQFIVSKGKVMVWSKEKGWELIQAPFHGITRPGTRRALHVIEDCIWTTFHPTDKTTPEAVLSDIIEPHESPVKSPAYKADFTKEIMP